MSERDPMPPLRADVEAAFSFAEAMIELQAAIDSRVPVEQGAEELTVPAVQRFADLAERVRELPRVAITRTAQGETRATSRCGFVKESDDRNLSRLMSLDIEVVYRGTAADSRNLEPIEIAAIWRSPLVNHAVIDHHMRREQLREDDATKHGLDLLEEAVATAEQRQADAEAEADLEEFLRRSAEDQGPDPSA